MDRSGKGSTMDAVYMQNEIGVGYVQPITVLVTDYASTGGNPTSGCSTSNMMAAMAGPRNADGLLLPVNSRSFNLLRGMYKILTILESIAVVLLVIVLLSALILPGLVQGRKYDDPQEEEKMKQLAQQLSHEIPFIMASMSMALLHNVIAWRVLGTMSLRFLRFDLMVQMMSLAFTVLSRHVLPMPETGRNPILSIMWHVLEIGIVFFMYHEIKKINRL